MTRKTCSKCKVEQPVEDFHHRASSKDGLYSYCKRCKSEGDKRYRDAHPEMMRARDQRYRSANPDKHRKYQKTYRETHKPTPAQQKKRWIERTYGLSIEAYIRMVVDQSNACLICQESTRLFVDHDHVTGEIRGLLCVRCNTGLGMMRDSEGILLAAVTYLRRAKLKAVA